MTKGRGEKNRIYFEKNEKCFSFSYLTLSQTDASQTRHMHLKAFKSKGKGALTRMVNTIELVRQIL
jgi:hypothetical protein